jgi:hypothetical protein
MSRNYTTFLWLLKLGAVPNVYFLFRAVGLDAETSVVVPALIFFAVSAYRCLWPVRYEHYVVLHDSVLSSVFATRALATFAEVAYTYLLARVLLRLNIETLTWVNGLARLMVLQIVICQACVWLAILGDRFQLYFYEELGWMFMYVENTLASAYLLLTADLPDGGARLLQWNLLFGVLYVPFQVANLRAVWVQAKTQGKTAAPWTVDRLAIGMQRSVQVKNRRTDGESWGGIVGATWMTGYWAVVLPLWVYAIVYVLALAPH